ncbi:tetratricopeptide repeat protein [Paenibacillus barengoltzii]|uniref:tetratricopeptide repeat protein n=1 Tax=Paenibacillus barengoltzii TaxID=343517 RepID=UPI000A082E42|nr:tetratricopeptide repeat protein [Paenibacillus barengoltzii]MEC2345199.1 tetratricopeptide repeat protein [Paenibacillus barengoltzii]SME94391.1 Tetratricopeptide repeat-containing protein [Paenibacillus barengoltzii]
MSKIFLFFLLSWLLGNPFLAIIILLLILYFIDRRYVGLFPSLSRPFKRSRNIGRLRQQLAASPFDVSAKRELARLLLERKKYTEALRLLEEAKDFSESSAEFWDDLGAACLGLGRIEEGEVHILHALSLNERVKYGQPYLRLASAFRERDPQKALQYAARFGEIQSSSSEAYYLLGSLYQSLGSKEEAKRAYTESIEVYRSLPKYKKRQERGWALRSYFKRSTMG